MMMDCSQPDAAPPAVGIVRLAISALAAAWLLLVSAGPAALATEPAATVTLTTSERRAVLEALNDDPDFDGSRYGAVSDSALWSLVLRHATRELGQRIEPAEIDPLWAISPPTHLVEVEAQAALAGGALGPWLMNASPNDRRYRALQGAQRRYREIVEAGGWPIVPPLAATDLSMSAREVLRARLVREGYLAADQADDGPDLSLKRAIADFQAHHGLPPDGVIGAQTLVALNVTAEARLAQIDANLERWRWSPRLPPTRIEVDAGGAQAVFFREESPQVVMRVVVGDLAHKTPMFASRVESLVFNPTWNVPTSIVESELLPRERAKPGYLARNGFVRVAGSIKQRPGPLNALGRVKFDFPNPFGVYLHDTPSHAAFAQANRWRSHGCVRLEDPRGLAAAVLAPQGWPAERIDGTIGAGATSHVPLAEPVPLYVFYWTVVMTDDKPTFRPDPYGWDQKLLQALSRDGGSGDKAQAGESCDSACEAAPLL